MKEQPEQNNTNNLLKIAINQFANNPVNDFRIQIVFNDEVVFSQDTDDYQIIEDVQHPKCQNE